MMADDNIIAERCAARASRFIWERMGSRLVGRKGALEAVTGIENVRRRAAEPIVATRRTLEFVKHSSWNWSRENGHG